MESTHINGRQVFLQKKCQVVPDTLETEMEDSFLFVIDSKIELF